ncbi:hypothetical protein Drorol1_Dr00004533 [Drosera rotundifolia]
MDDKSEADAPCVVGNETADDITVCLRTISGSSTLFLYKSSDLKAKSKFFADRISSSNTKHCIEIHCLDSDFSDHVELLDFLRTPAPRLVDSWKSVKYALNILKVAVVLQCEEIIHSCVQYLEACPWTDEEEEEITKTVPELGPLAMPILARTLPVDVNATRNVLIAAIQVATSISGPCYPFGNELITSAQEQVDYMLGEDDETQPLTSDEMVKSEIKVGLSNVFSLFQKSIASLHSEDFINPEALEIRVLQALAALIWLCCILPRFSLMRDFVSSWADISANILCVLDDIKFESSMWALKTKIIEVTTKVLEAVGYGNVILPPAFRVHLLRTWMPFIRKMKPLLDLREPYKMDDELCQNIEGSMVSLILSLPSTDQAEILADWMDNQLLKFPDLSEAFEIWCYRAKSAKRRLVEGLDRVGGTSTSSDLSA